MQERSELETLALELRNQLVALHSRYNQALAQHCEYNRAPYSGRRLLNVFPVPPPPLSPPPRATAVCKHSLSLRSAPPQQRMS